MKFALPMPTFAVPTSGEGLQPALDETTLMEESGVLVFAAVFDAAGPENSGGRVETPSVDVPALDQHETAAADKTTTTIDGGAAEQAGRDDKNTTSARQVAVQPVADLQTPDRPAAGPFSPGLIEIGGLKKNADASATPIRAEGETGAPLPSRAEHPIVPKENIAMSATNTDARIMPMVNMEAPAPVTFAGSVSPLSASAQMSATAPEFAPLVTKGELDFGAALFLSGKTGLAGVADRSTALPLMVQGSGAEAIPTLMDGAPQSSRLTSLNAAEPRQVEVPPATAPVQPSQSDLGERQKPSPVPQNQGFPPSENAAMNAPVLRGDTLPALATPSVQPAAETMADTSPADPVPLIDGTSVRTPANPTTMLPAKPVVIPQVMPHLAELAIPRADQIEITLSPDELGRVRLAATQTDNGVVLLVQAERTETLELMRRHMSDLLGDLQDMGFADINYSAGHQQDQPAQDSPSSAPDSSEPREDFTPQQTLPQGGLDLRL
ncbi:flagellar hook-length control protein FliK [Thalassovita sp.]|jgi:flagellar hook-length control protein FliK|uniref:flagellar hook-length control protein FliK n=1 Tax=Thalassovita sp. TaxID=1979401 RepID=UPI003B59FBA0